LRDKLGALIAFFHIPLEIRRVMYTPNIIESVNSKFRKVIASRRVFFTEESFVKMFIYGNHGAGTLMDQD